MKMESLPDYMIPAFKRVKKRCASLKRKDSLQFLFITDTHHSGSDNQLQTVNAVRQLADFLKLDAIISGGDHSDNGTKSNFLESQREIISGLTVEACPLLAVKGNHDDNSIYEFNHQSNSTEHVVFPEVSYNLYVKNLENIVTQDPNHPLGLYYYYDIPSKLTRIIVLNGIDIPYKLDDSGALQYPGQWKYAFSDRQLNWMAHQALNFSDKPERTGWRVLIFSHTAILQRNVFGIDEEIINGEIMWDIVKAFQQGSSYRSIPTTGDFGQQVEVDFVTSSPGNVIASMFGHVHFDQVVTEDGIPMISTLNAVASRHFEESPERKVGTISETAFDIVTVHFEQRRLYLTRFGAGVDRVVEY